MTRSLSVASLLAALVLAPFVSTGCTPAEVTVTATTAPVRMALIAPGIWVVEDHPYAVYYADGWYWMYRDDGWYRSAFLDGSFIPVDFPPPTIIRVHRPRIYVRYHAPRGTRVRVIRDHRSRPRDHRPQVRDHRR
jgi:hypothetical protein